MKFTESYKQLKFDQRMVEFNVARQEMTQEDIKKYLESLPDMSAQVEPLFPKEAGSASEGANGSGQPS